MRTVYLTGTHCELLCEKYTGKHCIMSYVAVYTTGTPCIVSCMAGSVLPYEDSNGGKERKKGEGLANGRARMEFPFCRKITGNFQFFLRQKRVTETHFSPEICLSVGGNTSNLYVCLQILSYSLSHNTEFQSTGI